jgi:hypothetical protein
MVSIFLSRARLALIFLPKKDMCRINFFVEAKIIFLFKTKEVTGFFEELFAGNKYVALGSFTICFTVLCFYKPYQATPSLKICEGTTEEG